MERRISVFCRLALLDLLAGGEAALAARAGLCCEQTEENDLVAARAAAVLDDGVYRVDEYERRRDNEDELQCGVALREQTEHARDGRHDDELLYKVPAVGEIVCESRVVFHSLCLPMIYDMSARSRYRCPNSAM